LDTVKAKRFSLAINRKETPMARCRLGKRERALRRLAFETGASQSGHKLETLVSVSYDVDKAARKVTRHVETVVKRVPTRKETCVSMSAGNYGPSCMVGLTEFRPGPKQWGYNGRTAGRIHRQRKA
jgi:hypothetical protein